MQIQIGEQKSRPNKPQIRITMDSLPCGSAHDWCFVAFFGGSPGAEGVPLLPLGWESRGFDSRCVGFFLRSLILNVESVSKQRSQLGVCRELTRCGSADPIRETKVQGVYRGEMG